MAAEPAVGWPEALIHRLRVLWILMKKIKEESSFSEEKEAKRLHQRGAASNASALVPQGRNPDKRFLVLFFQKRTLPASFFSGSASRKFITPSSSRANDRPVEGSKAGLCPALLILRGDRPQSEAAAELQHALMRRIVVASLKIVVDRFERPRPGRAGAGEDRQAGAEIARVVGRLQATRRERRSGRRRECGGLPRHRVCEFMHLAWTSGTKDRSRCTKARDTFTPRPDSRKS